ncbi:unnamed protein product [Sphenostylis stenocarpa]|uniref:Uncharacterized protein n=1 Tax=Sphenostylis stenocarpa TaxID=92480 RepID=A0AA86ST96_9FABA|nr:unnamed protein product [Sphenostylis stenocarpa]
MDAFFAWDVNSKSPLPAILADTLLSSHGDVPRSFEELLQNPSPTTLNFRMEGQVGTLGRQQFILGLPLVPTRSSPHQMWRLSERTCRPQILPGPLIKPKIAHSEDG